MQLLVNASALCLFHVCDVTVCFLTQVTFTVNIPKNLEFCNVMHFIFKALLLILQANMQYKALLLILQANMQY